MGKLRHIAITVPDPWAAAEFYRQAFGMTKVGETDHALARDSDYLVAACPGGPATRRIVNAPVLEALGKDGFLINIARGSVVDTDALIAALEKGSIAGAGLDVIDGEPVVPEALLKSNKVLFTPHMAGRTPEVIWNQLKLLLANIDAVLAGQPAPNRVPL